MNFAPFQDASPDINRVISPSISRSRHSNSPHLQNPNSPERPANSKSGDALRQNDENIICGGNSNESLQSRVKWSDEESGRNRLHEFETSLPIRLDHEACLAYLLLPPVGGFLLLIFEQQSDYVRFHACQSALVFTALGVAHLIVSWSNFLSWLLLFVDILLIAFLTRRAYRDAVTLDRYEVLAFGRLVSKILGDD
ncbi:UPF0132 domain protein, TIC20 superfamily [Blumeria hordei DH14]|uniref:UPF0132 domain protein, TIC20 superfamily n=1 Tax=Blumeria graminis f. sp. hordei (strain DH14) TaxID=546991 RepID=N1J7S2_BLUG1|nr:UPF0132 domain protein, TIC20 superfamily [Blumeria hordei DH14]